MTKGIISTGKEARTIRHETLERVVAISEQYISHLDLVIARSPLDPEDQAVASQEDRQGLGVSRPSGRT